MRWRIRKLSSQIFLAQLGILAISTGIGFALLATTIRDHLDESYQGRAATIAESFAEIPTIQTCLSTGGPDCTGAVQALATQTAARTGAAFIVVIDRNRIRHSHPDPSLIGQPVSEPLLAADGQVHLRIDKGSTGPTANAIVPLYSSDGAFIGEVSAGIHEETVQSALLSQLPSYAIWLAVMLLIGALGSWGLASFLKRRTFGLELDEIARLLQEREATLHGIREGVIAIDPSGRISVLNGEARRLLGLPANATDRRVADVVGPGPLRDLLSETTSATDEILITEDFWIVFNRMPVVLAGRPHGSVVTLQDRTIVEALTRELDGERSLTESMRAQHHEFANRMHGIAGLLELGRADEALDYVNEIRGTAADFDQSLRGRIAAPQIIGLMLGKAAEANERGVELTVSPDTRLGEAPERVQALTTILGNLVDNALDAVAGRRAPRRVTVHLVDDEDRILLEVSDTGPGVEREAVSRIFENGYTTKRGGHGRHSGLGLSLVHDLVSRLGGSVDVSEGPGATFRVVLPHVATVPIGGAE